MPVLPVKVCCIQDERELDLALAHGADAVGLLSEMPGGWGPIPEARIAALCRRVPPFVTSVLLTSRTEPQAIIAQQRALGARALQICDHFPEDAWPALRAALPGVQLLKVVHVHGAEALDEARRLDGQVDGLILDSGGVGPDGEVALGGTGRTHDWSISAAIVAAVDTPVFLAGGLKADNLAEAVARVQPYGIDLCTGVRRELRLDAGRLAAFMAALGAARGARLAAQGT